MLDLLRNKMKGILWVTVFAFVGTIFVSWGMGGAAKRKVSQVAVVNGAPISPQDYYNQLRRTQDYFRDMLGDNYNDELVAQLNLEQQVMETLIRDELMRQEARKMGLIVTDEEVLAKAKTSPQFLTDGRFDPAKYNAAVSNPRNANIWPILEQEMRDDLLVSKLELIIKNTVAVTEKETRELFGEKFDQYQIAYVELDPVSLLSKETVQKYYDEHQDELGGPQMAKASHILIATKTISEEEALKKAQDISSQLAGGADFAALAKKYSDDPGSKTNGGNLGFFTRGQMVPEFDKAAFSLPLNQVSEPIKTQFGYHLIKVTERKGGDVPPLNEIFKRVAQKALEAQEVNPADGLAARIKAKVMEVGSLEKAAPLFNLSAKTSELFKASEQIAADLPWNEELGLGIMALDVNEVSGAINAGSKTYVVQLKQKLPGEEKEYQKEQASLNKEIFERKSQDVLHNWYESVRAQADVKVLIKEYENAVKAYTS